MKYQCSRCGTVFEGDSGRCPSCGAMTDGPRLVADAIDLALGERGRLVGRIVSAVRSAALRDATAVCNAMQVSPVIKSRLQFRAEYERMKASASRKELYAKIDDLLSRVGESIADDGMPAEVRFVYDTQEAAPLLSAAEDRVQRLLMTAGVCAPPFRFPLERTEQSVSAYDKAHVSRLYDLTEKLYERFRRITDDLSLYAAFSHDDDYGRRNEMFSYATDYGTEEETLGDEEDAPDVPSLEEEICQAEHALAEEYDADPLMPEFRPHIRAFWTAFETLCHYAERDVELTPVFCDERGETVPFFPKNIDFMCKQLLPDRSVAELRVALSGKSEEELYEISAEIGRICNE